VLAGTLFALGMLAGSASTALAAPGPHPVSAHHAVSEIAAPTSSFVAYTGQDFTGNAHDIGGCGPHNLPLPIRSYKWFARGQSGRMYNCTNEACAVNFVLPSNQNASSTTGVGWRSMFIVC
jgi:hypothetical protein